MSAQNNTWGNKQQAVINNTLVTIPDPENVSLKLEGDDAKELFEALLNGGEEKMTLIQGEQLMMLNNEWGKRKETSTEATPSPKGTDDEGSFDDNSPDGPSKPGSQSRDSESSSSDLEIDTGDEKESDQTPPMNAPDENINLLAHLASTSNPLIVKDTNICPPIPRDCSKKRSSSSDSGRKNKKMKNDSSAVTELDCVLGERREELRALERHIRDIQEQWDSMIRLKKLVEEDIVKLRRRKQVLMMEKRSEAQPQNGVMAPMWNGQQHSAASILSQLAGVASNGVGQQHSNVQGGSGGCITSLLTNLNIPLKGGTPTVARPTPILPKLPDPTHRGNSLVNVQTLIAEHRARNPEVVKARPRRRWRPAASTDTESECSEASASADVPIHGDAVSSTSSPLVRGSLDDSRSYKDVLLQLAYVASHTQNMQEEKITKPASPPTIQLKENSSQADGTSALAQMLADLSKDPVSPHPSGSLNSQPSLLALLDNEKSSDNRPPEVSRRLNQMFNDQIKRIYTASPSQDDGSDKNSSGPATPRVPSPDAEQTSPPKCHWCKDHPAQFVCAGCSKQWYCSRRCQVGDWDEHADLCSST